MKRVFHPTGNAFQDVADDAVKDWTDAGWRKTAHPGVDQSENPEPGSWAPVDIPREAAEGDLATASTTDEKPAKG